MWRHGSGAEIQGRQFQHSKSYSICWWTARFKPQNQPPSFAKMCGKHGHGLHCQSRAMDYTKTGQRTAGSNPATEKCVVRNEAPTPFFSVLKPKSEKKSSEGKLTIFTPNIGDPPKKNGCPPLLEETNRRRAQDVWFISPHKVEVVACWKPWRSPRVRCAFVRYLSPSHWYSKLR